MKNTSQLANKDKNLVDLLRWRAIHQTDQRAYTFLVDGETEAIHLTYGELDQQARAIGGWLQQMGAAGQRILLPYPPGLEFIAAFFGCLYAGVFAVPVHPPSRRKALNQLTTIFKDAQASRFLTTGSLLKNLENWFDEAPELKTTPWLTTDDILTNIDLAETWQAPGINADTLAFLQYTSGSTATPKGVMLAHRHLINNIDFIVQTSGFEPENHREGVSWLPPYHDLGLVGVICLGIYAGRPFTLMSPVSFIQKPWRWLQTISQTKATYSAGPNFAYDLCVDKITVGQMAELDLSNWEIAIIGSEPIRYKTLERFATTFAPCGFRREAFYPAYGVSETTLVISGGLQTDLPVNCTVQKRALKDNQVITTPIDEPDSQTLVGCGRPLVEHQVIIVDPQTLQPCSPDRVGEIWISGPSVAQGYWHQPAATKQVFEAYLANGDGPFLRTGDMGFLYAGQLFIAGRLKDMIIIRGRNYYPQDIEQAAEESHPALNFNSGAAFSVDIDDQEQLIIVFELARQHRKANVEEVAAAIRTAVAETFAIETYAVVLIKTGYLPRTASGKIQRFQCRNQFLEETLPILGLSIHRPTDNLPEPQKPVEGTVFGPDYQQLRQQLETAVQTQLAEFLQVPSEQIDFQRSIQSLGLGSLHATAIKYRIESEFDLDLSPEIFFEDITLEQFVTRVAIQATSSEIES